MNAYIKIEVPSNFKKGNRDCPCCLTDCFGRQYCRMLKPTEGSVMHNCIETDCPLILKDEIIK